MVKQELLGIKRDIGLCLTRLRDAKEYPDNYTISEIKLLRDKLSLLLRLKNRLFQIYPELRPVRVRQMRLL